MKKTSIIFLVIAVLLLVSGIVLRNKGIEKAEKNDQPLFKQTLTDEGDLIERFEYSPLTINKINVNLDKNTNVNIIGNAEKCYVEIVNYNALQYTVYPNNHTLTIEDDTISALMGRAEGGDISFNGVRDYIRNDKYNEQKCINIYIATGAEVKIFDISILDGNVKIDNVPTVCDYTILMKEGNIETKNTPDLSLFKCKLDKGNVSVDKAKISNTDIDVKNGNVTFTTPIDLVYDYTVTSETGSIKYNDESYTGSYTTENDEIDGLFTVKVGVGNVTIKTFEKTDFPTTVQPNETTEAPAETTGA